MQLGCPDCVWEFYIFAPVPPMAFKFTIAIALFFLVIAGATFMYRLWLKSLTG
jgi:hypothetical protein